MARRDESILNLLTLGDIGVKSLVVQTSLSPIVNR